MAAVKTALDAVAKALNRCFVDSSHASASETLLKSTCQRQRPRKEHKLPALMQAIAVMPVLEPWTVHSSSTSLRSIM